MKQFDWNKNLLFFKFFDLFNASFFLFRAAIFLTCISFLFIRHIFMKFLFVRFFFNSAFFCSLAANAMSAFFWINSNFFDWSDFRRLRMFFLVCNSWVLCSCHCYALPNLQFLFLKNADDYHFFCIISKWNEFICMNGIILLHVLLNFWFSFMH